MVINYLNVFYGDIYILKICCRENMWKYVEIKDSVTQLLAL